MRAAPKRNHVVVQESVVKLQALFRGYYVRKKLKQTKKMFSNISAVQVEDTVNLSPELVIDITSERIEQQSDGVQVEVKEVAVKTIKPKCVSEGMQVETEQVNEHSLPNGTVYTGTFSII